MDEVTIALFCRDNLRVATIHIILSLSQEEEKSENPMHMKTKNLSSLDRAFPKKGSVLQLSLSRSN
jgi:hypothetical protein